MSNTPSTAPTSRTKIRRLAELANHDKSVLYGIIDESYVCHIAFNDGKSTHCIPTASWRIDNHLYIHGSNGSRLIKRLSSGIQASIAITHVDGLVLARSAFSNTMNYRSAVIYGVFEEVDGNEQKMVALDAFMEKIATGRKNEARPGNKKELAATSVLRISLNEFATKISNADPDDKEEDLNLPVWAGVLPLTVKREAPRPFQNGSIPTPAYVEKWANV
ncbi:pyridoxamine 5'-phosphate oxidase family protein [Pseudorhodoferax sp.]|uniref:pyridoxamine 5'-phosphate oxidase family protein n=1 Tax=Pseudorhodoferax sp. TaxID=1993553 RepID=UPI002DD6580A|nr:pyridoxamine 5'-phosphate oxidase family protein [Pseudorhodoferax sp.]